MNVFAKIPIRPMR